MNYHFLKISSFLFSFFLTGVCNSQNIGCIDSLTFNRFLSPYFGAQVGKTLRDQADNIYINSTARVMNVNYNGTIKFNATNEVVWFKNYQPNIFTQITPNALSTIDAKANLFYLAPGQNLSNGILKNKLLKLDSATNFIWGKEIYRTDFPSSSSPINVIEADANEFIFAIGRDGINTTNTWLMALDKNGNARWSKCYNNVSLPDFKVFQRHIVSQNNSTLVLFVHFFYNMDQQNGLQVVRINKTDGNIIDQKTFMYYNDAAHTSPNNFTIQKIRYSITKGTFFIDSWGEIQPLGFGRDYIFTLLDNDLNLLSSTIYKSDFVNPPESVNISDDNYISIVLNNPLIAGNYSNTLYYSVFDNNQNAVSQKKIALSTLGFPFVQLNSEIVFKKDGILNFQILGNVSSSTNNPLYLFDNSPFYNGISNCLGEDTVLFNKGNIYCQPESGVVFTETGLIPIFINDLMPDLPVNRTMQKTELCKAISICDTIKIFGTTYHCLSSPLDSFKIFSNPLCLRKTNWQVDTAYIKILSQTDTSLYVQYLQPYRGSIKVGFGGCSLTDEIPIEVYAAQPGVNLGNDTLQCPGKTITLKAGKNFRTYLWQDGSSKDSLIAAQHGIYHITATDSCGNVFKDTLVIKPFDVVLKADHPQTLCPGDTATFILPNQLINYSWLPATNSSLINFTWKLFPAVTTIYSITGQRLPGCTLSDTVLINVKPICIPDYMYFPNAFTPNNNGLNDTYKPGFNGQLVLYELIIYNRYGQPVFKTTNATQGWDGHFKNSSKPLTGSYVWSCKYQFVGRPVQQEQGTFMLIR